MAQAEVFNNVDLLAIIATNLEHRDVIRMIASSKNNLTVSGRVWLEEKVEFSRKKCMTLQALNDARDKLIDESTRLSLDEMQGTLVERLKLHDKYMKAQLVEILKIHDKYMKAHELYMHTLSLTRVLLLWDLRETMRMGNATRKAALASRIATSRMMARKRSRHGV